jgi:hypothetical protein
LRARSRTAFLDDEDEEIDTDIMSLGYESGERDGAASGRSR